MLKRLERPVHIVFFHDPMMRETVELYQLIAAQTPRVTVEFYDPMINPAQARMLGVKFAGHRGHGKRGPPAAGQRRQRDGHRQRHPARVAERDRSACASSTATASRIRSAWSPTIISRARPATRTAWAPSTCCTSATAWPRRATLWRPLNYMVEKVLLLQRANAPRRLRGAGGGGAEGAAAARPRSTAIRRYLAEGGNALFMLDPFVRTGLEPVLREYGVVVDDDIVIDEASHFWADVSAPAVTDYNRHQVTRDLPLTFFPGARSLSPTPAARARHLGGARSSTRRSTAGARPSPDACGVRRRAGDVPGPEHADGGRAAAARRGAATARRRAEGRSRVPRSRWWATRTSPPTPSSTSWATARCS